jgi:hypothetical protein
MSGSNKTQTNQTQSYSSGPWAPAQGALTAAINPLQGALSQSQSNNAATIPSNFTAGLTPQQIQQFQQMIGYGGNLSTPSFETNTGTGLAGTGVGATNSAVSGLQGYNPFTATNPQSIVNAANQYVSGQNIPAEVQNAMQQANETARDITLPGIDSAAAGTGNTNSSRTGIASGIVQRGLAEQAGNLSGSLQSQAFGQGITNALNAATANNGLTLSGLGALGNVGANATGQGLGATSNAISDASNLFNIGGVGGAGLQTGNQLGLTNQLQQNQFGTQNPFASLSNYLPLIESLGQLGQQGVSNTQGTTTTTPSALSMIGGILGAGGSLLGSTNPSTGSSSGLGGIGGLLSLLRGGG